MPGLLAVCDRNEHIRVVFPDHKFLRNRAVNARFDLRQAFFFAHRQIVALINAARSEQFCQNRNQFRLPLLQSQAGDLEG